MIFVIGGTDGAGATTIVEAFEFSGVWHQMKPLNTPRIFLAAATVGQSDLGFIENKVYAIGGSADGMSALATVEVFDPHTRTWSFAESLPTARAGLAAVANLDDRIYTFGGFNSVRLSTVEVFDPLTGNWTTRNSMPTARNRLAAAAASDGSSIYVIGGEGGSDILEIFHPSTNSWKTGPRMPAGRSGHAAVLGPDGRVFVAGGQDDQGFVVNTVFAYDPGASTWTTETPMPTKRCFLAAPSAVPDGGLYAVGGQNDLVELFATLEQGRLGH
jgi:N-acetylneuraminic acid mutarotase